MRQGKLDVDLVKPFAMVAARRLEDDAAGSHASTPLLKVLNAGDDRLTKALNELHSLRINLEQHFQSVVPFRQDRSKLVREEAAD